MHRPRIRNVIRPARSSTQAFTRTATRTATRTSARTSARTSTRTSSRLITTLLAGLIVASCGDEDATAPVLTPSLTEPAAITSPLDVFTPVGGAEGTDDVDAEDGVTDGAGSSNPTTIAGLTTTTTKASATAPTTTGPGTGPTTTIAGGIVSSTTSAGAAVEFQVLPGIADLDGQTAPSIDVRARSGSSGNVAVATGGILRLYSPGPVAWDLTEEYDDLDGDAFDYLDAEDVLDGAADPFLETGGATIITLRALKAGSWTLVVEPIDGPGEQITIRVTVT